ncbi:MAG: hypothetical protein JNM85_05660 [Chthonomonas sp.]|nr:hypothetical protein [Chthonomonas sp.]
MSGPIQNSKIQDLLTTRVDPRGTAQTTAPKPSDAPEFAAILDNRLKLSGHAQTRLKSRDIEFGPAEMERVIGGVDRAAAKGSKESLVLMDDVALVVSVKNRTVITAVDRQALKENVFTNIDSAVIV